MDCIRGRRLLFCLTLVGLMVPALAHNRTEWTQAQDDNSRSTDFIVLRFAVVCAMAIICKTVIGKTAAPAFALAIILGVLVTVLAGVTALPFLAVISVVAIPFLMVIGVTAFPFLMAIGVIAFPFLMVIGVIAFPFLMMIGVIALPFLLVIGAFALPFLTMIWAVLSPFVSILLESSDPSLARAFDQLRQEVVRGVRNTLRELEEATRRRRRRHEGAPTA